MSFTTWIIGAILCFVFFLGSMLVGIQRKNLNAVIFAVLMFFLGIGAAAMAVFVFLT